VKARRRRRALGAVICMITAWTLVFAGPSASLTPSAGGSGHWTPTAGNPQGEYQRILDVVSLADSSKVFVTTATAGGGAGAQIYDPVTGGFTTAARIPAALSGGGGSADPKTSSTALPNGKVLYNKGGSTWGVYNPSSDGWTMAPPSVHAFYRYTATPLTGGNCGSNCNKVLVVGVSDPSAGLVANAELYDPATSTWTPAAPPRSGTFLRDQGALRLVDGRVLVVAGTTAELFDPAGGSTGSWAAARSPSLPHGFGSQLVAIARGDPNGAEALALGSTDVGGYADRNESYTPTPNGPGAWTTIAGCGCVAGSATLLENGDILVLDNGAARTDRGPKPPPGRVYDPPSGTWASTGARTATASDPSVVATVAARIGGPACGANCEKVLAVGAGADGAGHRGGAELYDTNPQASTGINPPTGPRQGGTTVDIKGRGLTGATQVSFDSTVLTCGPAGGKSPCWTDPEGGGQSIFAVTPAHRAGPVNVTVTTASGEPAVAVNGFTYLLVLPRVDTLSATCGPPEGGTAVIVSGTHLSGATAVQFGARVANNVAVVSDTTITAVSPASTASSAAVTVITPDGTSTASPGATYGSPCPPPPTNSGAADPAAGPTTNGPSQQSGSAGPGGGGGAPLAPGPAPAAVPSPAPALVPAGASPPAPAILPMVKSSDEAAANPAMAAGTEGGPSGAPHYAMVRSERGEAARGGRPLLVAGAAVVVGGGVVVAGRRRQSQACLACPGAGKASRRRR